MNSPMLCSVSALCKPLVADVAFIGLLTSMNPHVLFQFEFIVKLFITLSTLMVPCTSFVRVSLYQPTVRK